MSIRAALLGALPLLACQGSGLTPPTDPVPDIPAAVRIEGGGQVLLLAGQGAYTGAALQVPVGPLIVLTTFVDAAGRPLGFEEVNPPVPVMVPVEPARLDSDRTGPWRFHLHGRAAGRTSLRLTLRPGGGGPALFGPVAIPVDVVDPRAAE